jgi:hypothetical protein
MSHRFHSVAIPESSIGSFTGRERTSTPSSSFSWVSLVIDQTIFPRQVKLNMTQVPSHISDNCTVNVNWRNFLLTLILHVCQVLPIFPWNFSYVIFKAYFAYGIFLYHDGFADDFSAIP